LTVAIFATAVVAVYDGNSLPVFLVRIITVFSNQSSQWHQTYMCMIYVLSIITLY